MAGAGFEDPRYSSEKKGFPSDGDAKSDAISTGTGWKMVESPALFARLATAWNRLSDADRLKVVENAERMAEDASDAQTCSRTQSDRLGR